MKKNKFGLIIIVLGVLIIILGIAVGMMIADSKYIKKPMKACLKKINID